jgi:hypothetical protein
MSKPLLRGSDLTWSGADDGVRGAPASRQAHKDAIAAFLEKRL